MLHLIGQLSRKIALNVSNSDIPPNLHAALISIHAASFYPAI
jgi:hypothetical protein